MSRKEPLSVEALLEKKRQEQEVKPKFLSKAERQKLALERRQQEIDEKKQKEEKERLARIEFEKRAREIEREKEAERAGPSRQQRDPRGYHHGRDRYADWRQDSRRGDQRHDQRYDQRYDARQDPPRHPSSAASRPTTNGDSGPNATDSPLTDAEQRSIKDHYLGIRKPHQKKTRRMLNDKKFMFDHDAETDDTSDKLRPELVAGAVEPRGGRAGMDPAEYAKGDGVDHLLRKGGKSAFAEKHWTEKALDEMKERDWRIFREDFSIAARGGHIPRPLRSWRESTIPDPILRVVEEIGYKEPSPIQRQAIPIGLQNRDLIGIAETGSGKTASFVIPMLAYISKLPRLSEANKHLGPYALIIAPTRELAQQIEGETRKFTDSLGFRVVSIVGGRDMNEQAFNLRDGAEIIVATPGRLKDCVERHVLVLSQCLYLVLDEADKSIGLGFADVLDYILDSMPASNLKPDTEEAENPLQLLAENQTDAVPRYRVTMLYSATMPPSVERLARTYLRRPATITIGDANQAVGTVEQRVEFIAGEDKKKARMMQILASGFEPPIIVFATTKQAVDSLAKEIQRAGYNPAVLHSGKTQTQREAALESLRSGEAPVLVATDLAGRGIDVPDVSLVINVYFPTNMEAYIHRIGRTGRAGKRGLAITFLEPSDEEFYYDLKHEISRSPISQLPRELERHPAAQQRMTREMRRKRDEE